MVSSYTNSPSVVTLIGNPSVMRLAEAEMHSVVDALQASGAIIEHVEWLAPEEACDIYFAVLPLDEAQQTLLHLLANVPFDFVVQPTNNRRKSLLISDMDSTMIQQECIDELADFIGLKPEIAAVTERAMNGELEFKQALRERVALLRGLSESVLQEAYDKHITFTDGAYELVQTMRQHNAECILVSGGFTFFTERVMEALGFHFQHANILEIEDGKLTGSVREPILDSDSKRQSLFDHTGALQISRQDVLAIGDGANDLPMILEAGLGVAYHAKPHVREEALRHGAAKIDHCDLRALLYAQGYSNDECVQAK